MSSSFNLELLERVLQGCREEYSDKNSNYTKLNDKAQNIISTAGIFLAAVLIFVDQDFLKVYSTSGGCLEKILLSLAVVLLLISVLFSLIGARISRVKAPPSSRQLSQMSKDLLKLNEQDRTDYKKESHLQDVIHLWQEALDDLSRKNESKVKWIRYSELVLPLAILLVGILLLIVLL